MFGDPLFAKNAGTRNHAMIDSWLFEHLDRRHNRAISFIADGVPSGAGDTGPDDEMAQQLDQLDPVAGLRAEGNEDDPLQNGASQGVPVDPLHNAPEEWVPGDDDAEWVDNPLHHVDDPDPRDELPPPEGDTITLFFGLFVDGVQLHQHGRSTTAVICVKCLDLPCFLATTDHSCYPLAFIDGPKEPTNMSEIMQYVLKAFKVSEPMGEWLPDGGFRVTGCPIEVFDCHRRRNRYVYPIFVFAFADTPARRGWLLTTGHTSKSGCDRCGLVSTRTLPCGTQIGFNGFTGYTAPTRARYWDDNLGVCPFQTVPLLCRYSC